jgi:hypothetical protein
MKPAPFDYFAPTNVDEVRDLLNTIAMMPRFLPEGRASSPPGAPALTAIRGDWHQRRES